jgi:competence ComEA-like helix-hairpin-helix protein
LNRLVAPLILLGSHLAFLAHSVIRPVDATEVASATIEFLDVGQGDAILIRSPEGKTALIDAGPSARVVSLLERRGIKSLDLVAVSHHHIDHYGGMEAVIRAFHPRVFLASNSTHTSPHYLKLLRTVRDSRIQPVVPTDSPRRIDLGSVRLTVLPQPPEDPDNENDNSIGMRLQHGAFSTLLTGDSEAAERAHWERVCPDLVRGCEVLKLAHHGSRNGVDAHWLDLVHPRLAVASLGRDNEFGHPHPETLSLLKRQRIPLARTDRDGTIVVKSDGERWSAYRRADSEPTASRAHEPRDRSVRSTAHARSVDRRRGSINLNTATLDELEELPGIGPVLAERIVEGRPYRSVEDLRKVRDIGETRLEKIRPFVRVR